jgi:hypothetical protein
MCEIISKMSSTATILSPSMPAWTWLVSAFCYQLVFNRFCFGSKSRVGLHSNSAEPRRSTRKGINPWPAIVAETLSDAHCFAMQASFARHFLGLVCRLGTVPAGQDWTAVIELGATTAASTHQPRTPAVTKVTACPAYRYSLRHTLFWPVRRMIQHEVAPRFHGHKRKLHRRARKRAKGARSRQ